MKSAPDLDDLLANGMQIIKNEITRLSKQSKQEALSHSEIDNLNMLLRLILAVRKEERDQVVEMELEKLDGKEMDVLVRQALGYLKKDK